MVASRPTRRRLVAASKYTVEAVAIALCGLLPGVFVVFNSVFSDVHSTSERVSMSLYVLVVFLVLATVTAGLTRSRTLPLWLGLAGTLILALYARQETDVLPAACISFGAMALGIELGTAAGLWVRVARSRRSVTAG
jgi:hypothetical protein